MIALLIKPPKIPKNPGICCSDCTADTAQKKPAATTAIKNQERPQIRAMTATRNQRNGFEPMPKAWGFVFFRLSHFLLTYIIRNQCSRPRFESSTSAHNADAPAGSEPKHGLRSREPTKFTGAKPFTPGEDEFDPRSLSSDPQVLKDKMSAARRR